MAAYSDTSFSTSAFSPDAFSFGVVVPPEPTPTPDVATVRGNLRWAAGLPRREGRREEVDYENDAAALLLVS